MTCARWLVFVVVLLSQATDARSQDVVLKGHTEEVKCVSYSPDGKTIATGGDDATVRLWDAATGKELRRFDGHSRYVRQVGFALNGKLLLSAGGDIGKPGEVFVWEAASGKKLHAPRLHDDMVFRLVVAPDGKTVATVSLFGKRVLLWDAETGKILRAVQPREEPGVLRFLNDGKQLAVAQEGKFDFFNVESGKKIATMPWLDGYPASIAEHRDGAFAVGGKKGGLIFRKDGKLKLPILLEDQKAWVHHLEFLRNGTLVALERGKLHFFGKEPDGAKKAGDGYITVLALHPEGRSMALAIENDCIIRPIAAK